MSVEEPLSLIAPLAAELAPQHCSADARNGGTCAWYHGTVDYLRLLGVMSSPAEDCGFLMPAFARLAADPAFRRVLVSGAGDCAMLGQLVSGFRSAAAEPSVMLIDRCATPVRLNEWFAERLELPLETAVVGILDFDSAETFDLICTHCFLGYFTPDERVRLFAKWFSLLRPGGTVVTVNPIRDTPDHGFLGFSAAQAASFEDRALAAARTEPALFPAGEPSLQKRVRAFTKNFGSYPIRSVEEFAGLFEDAGFVLEQCGPLPGAGSGVGAPGEHGPAYHSAIARRP